MRNIRFQRYHFDMQGNCYHVSEWGKDVNGSSFAMPPSLSNEDKSKAVDCQFTSFVVNGRGVYEGDKINCTYYHQRSANPDDCSQINFIGPVIFEDGCFFVVDPAKQGHSQYPLFEGDLHLNRIEGNIYMP